MIKLKNLKLACDLFVKAAKGDFDVEEVAVRDVIVKLIKSPVNEYVDWYVEQGLKLPSEYATDPGQWTMHLMNIKDAINKIHNASKDVDLNTEDLARKLELLGKNLAEMNDVVRWENRKH